MQKPHSVNNALVFAAIPRSDILARNSGRRDPAARPFEKGVQLRHLTISLILSLSAAYAFAGEDVPTEVPVGEIAGIVTNEAGQPIEGAVVDAWIWYPGNEVKTDKDGHFHLKNLGNRGPIELRVARDGFSPW